ncbi:TrbC/VirB2 family protein [Porphyrobacter sp. GA68]|uniref:TrbC/VirB2 family protein n=1 Tax=Porphyrobacter sp. GA68 TaxID=2883480 RepID=UPI001D18D6FE|nr:TrbC/VirB2 family protein [Porphyrobacter sp. GA68]
MRSAPPDTLFAPAAAAPLQEAASWLAALLTGSLASGLCVLAVAVVGLLLLTGRLAVREGMRVVLGCFVLLGAPVIAGAFVTAGVGVAERPSMAELPRTLPESRQELPPSAFDPYAGASVRDDR